MALGNIRVIAIRCFALGEHGCSIAFAGLEFTNRVQLMLTLCSVLLLVALVFVALSYGMDVLKRKRESSQ